MSSKILGRGSSWRKLGHLGVAIVLLGLLAVVFSSATSQAAQPAQAQTCTDPGIATIVDPVGGAIQVRMYGGTNPANAKNYPTGIQRIELSGGQVIYGYCIDSIEARITDLPVCLLSDIADVQLNYLIAKYPPDVQDRIKHAAQQAAVWHFSNGINLNLADPTTEGPAVDAPVAALYTAIVSQIDAIDPANPPAILRPGPLAMNVAPVTAINDLPLHSSHQITVTLTKGGFPLGGIDVQVAANFGQFNQATGTTDANGQAKFTISSTVAGTANITATAVVTVPNSVEYVVEQDPAGLQPFGIPSSTVQTLTAYASKQWRTTIVTPTPTATPTNTPTTVTPTNTPTNTPTPTTATATDTPTNTPTTVTPVAPGDSDGDGHTDVDECPIASSCPDTDGDGIPDYLDSDDDNDSILTINEPPGDVDGDGKPNYLDPDDDGDGILTVVEGQVDPDGDGIPAYLDPDDDNDSILTVDEPPGDVDGDGKPNYLDPDDDGDGILTVIEGQVDPDGDGIPAYLDPDDDNDSVLTINEPAGDIDGDGKPNYLDPNDDGDGRPTIVEHGRDDNHNDVPDEYEAGYILLLPSILP